MPEPSAVQVISNADGRLPASLSIDGEVHRVTSIIREWQVRGEQCFEVQLADGLTGGPGDGGRSMSVGVRGGPEGEQGG